MPNDTIPLPGPWDYCYEWDGPFGTRKFSTASYNGNRPDRSVPIYTADQMHAHAAAVSAAARDCRTCKRFYDWEEKVCTQSNKNPCVNGDKHDPLPPVRLWRTT